MWSPALIILWILCGLGGLVVWVAIAAAISGAIRDRRRRSEPGHARDDRDRDHDRLPVA
jgi:hypothetical protein